MRLVPQGDVYHDYIIVLCQVSQVLRWLRVTTMPRSTPVKKEGKPYRSAHIIRIMALNITNVQHQRIRQFRRPAKLRQHTTPPAFPYRNNVSEAKFIEYLDNIC